MKKVLVTHYIKLQTIIHIRLKICHQVVHQTNNTNNTEKTGFIFTWTKINVQNKVSYPNSVMIVVSLKFRNYLNTIPFL